MTEPKLPKRPLWQRVLIWVSAGLNLVIIGAVAGLLLSGGPNDRRPPLRFAGVAPMIGLLPDDMRKEVFGDMRSLGRDIGMSHRDLAVARGAVIQIVTAEPFDREAFLAVLREDQEAFAQYTNAGHLLLADAVAGMTPQAREAYAERLKRFNRFKRSPDERHSHKDKKDTRD